MKIKNLSIITKVNIIVVLFIVLIMIFIGTVLYFYQRWNIYKNANEEINQIAMRLKNNIFQPAWEYDYDQINLVLFLEMKCPHVYAMLFKNSKGDIEAGKVKNNKGEIVNYSEKYMEDFKSSLIYKVIDVPVKRNDFKIGTVTIYVTKKNIQKKLIYLILQNIFYIIILSVLLSFVIILTLKKIILNNISTLEKTVRKFNNEDFNIRAPQLKSNDELGRLFKNFNIMADAIYEYSKIMEEKVRKRTLKLEEANRQKTNFFINIAHETKTPLTLISNYLDKYIKKHGLTEELTIVKHNIDKLSRDMVNFLDIEKLRRGQNYYNHDQIINLSNLLLNKVLLFNELADNKNIKIQYNVNKDIYTKLDPFAADRIINNIIDNCIRYTNPDGKISIFLKSIKNKIELMIADTGIGISDEQLENILKPYFQISHKKSNVQGIGVGLSIVKLILDNVKGSININSKISEGTAFTILLNQYFPDENDEIIESIKCSIPINSISQINIKESEFDENKKTILLVEDNKEMIAYLYYALINNYNVFYELNGKDALNKLETIPVPDLIISDIMMDEMDGYAFYKELSKNGKYIDVPFIFLTAKTAWDEKINSLKMGVIDFIYKPFLMNELISKIDSIIKILDSKKNKEIDKMKDKISILLNKDDENKKFDFNFISKCNEYDIKSIEQKIIKMLLNGNIYKEISLKLDLPVNTLKKKIHKIYKKININNKIELINVFMKR